MTKIIIRRLSPLDVVDYRAIRLHGLLHDPVAFTGCYDQEVHLSIAEFAERMPDPASASAIFGAYLDEQLVGIIGLERSPVVKLQHKALLWGLYTLPEARGIGVGRALMEHLLDYARSQQTIERVHLVVVQSNESARQWYERQGFRLYGVERNAVKFDFGYEHDELRVLDLCPSE